MAFNHISIVKLPSDPTANYVVPWFPRPSNFYHLIPDAISRYGSIAIPYAILVNIGGLTVVSAAKAEGNNYNIALTQMLDAVCTIGSGIFGGVTQTTPYLGHTVYHKAFKCRSFYTVANGLFIGLGGLFGYVSFISEILPKSATLPIFIFVAFEIVTSTFHDESTPRSILVQHAPAIVLAIFPAIAQVLLIILSQLYSGDLQMAAVDPDKLAQLHPDLSASTISTLGVVVVLAHGFIATSLLWGSALAFVVDKKLGAAACMLLLCAVFSFFGIIHSVDPAGSVYVPWQSHSDLPYHWAVGYVCMAIVTLLSRYFIKPDEDFGF